MNKSSFAVLVSLCAAAHGGTIFLPGYPDKLLAIDESTHKIVDRIPSEIGIPTSISQSYDRKKIYVTSNDRNGIEIIDIASRRVIDHFVLNTGNQQHRIYGIAPDPEDKVLYTIVRDVTKQADRYEIGKYQYAVIDLAQKKIVRTAEIPADGQEGSNPYPGMNPFHVSPDGKYMYLAKNQRTMAAEFPCRPRFSFGISGDGKHLYLYGAGFEIESWNAATLKREQTIDLENDVTMGGIIVVP